MVIEEVWRKKPRQTDVVAFWGKIAAHMLLFRLCSRRVDKRQAGSKYGGIFVYYIFYYSIVDGNKGKCSLNNGSGITIK